MARKTARDKFLDAVHNYGNAVGEAQWTHGYRAGNHTKEAELYRREMDQWAVAGAKWEAMKRALSAYLRAATKRRNAKRAVSTVGAQRKKS